jgi:hypothetical protein
MTLSSIKQWWTKFDWKVWQADGMQEQEIDDEQIDPHYKQMLKVGLSFWRIVSWI